MVKALWFILFVLFVSCDSQGMLTRIGLSPAAQLMQLKSIEVTKKRRIKLQKEILQSYYPFLKLTIRSGRLVPDLGRVKGRDIAQLHQLRLEKKHIPIECCDRVMTLPVAIIASSRMLTEMMKRDFPEKPVCLRQYQSSILKEIHTLAQSSVCSIKEILEKYTLEKLINQFDVVHSLTFPETIQRVFKEQIIAVSARMNVNDLVKNKDVITKLDSQIPEFASIVKKSTGSYLKVMDSEGIISYVPEAIVQMSHTLCTILEDLECTISQDISIPLTQCHHSIVSELCTIIDQKAIAAIKKAIQTYPLETLIDMANCLEYLAFKDKTIVETFHDKILELCTPILLRQLPEKLKNLNYDLQDKIIRRPVVEYFKHCLVNDQDKKTVIKIGAEKIIFSPNGQMLVSSKIDFYTRNGYIFLWNFCLDDNLYPICQSIPCCYNDVNSLAFSPDNKSLVAGFNKDNNNLLKLTVIDDNQKFIFDNELLINPWLEGHSVGIRATVFHPTGKAMISTDREGNVLLWTINTDGIANGKSIQLDCAQIKEINSAAFSSDGTILVCAGRGIEKNTIFVWNFTDNGAVQHATPKIYSLPKGTSVQSVSFIPNSKKFIATSYSHGQVDFSSTFLCDLSAKDMQCCAIEEDIYRDYKASFVSPDGKKLVKITNKSAFLFTIHGNDILYDYPLVVDQDINCIAFSLDSTKIAIGGKENSIILKLLTDEDRKICSNISMNQAFLLNKMIFGGGIENFNASDYKTIPPRLISLLRETQLISDQEYPITEEEQLLLKKRDIRKSILACLGQDLIRGICGGEELLSLYKLGKTADDEKLVTEVLGEVGLLDRFNEKLLKIKKLIHQELLSLYTAENINKTELLIAEINSKQSYVHCFGPGVESIFDEVAEEVKSLHLLQ